MKSYNDNKIFLRRSDGQVIAIQWKSMSHATKAEQQFAFDSILDGSHKAIIAIVPSYMFIKEKTE